MQNFFFSKFFSTLLYAEKKCRSCITSVKQKSLKTKSVFKVQQMYFETYFETKDMLNNATLKKETVVNVGYLKFLTIYPTNNRALSLEEANLC